MVEVDENSFTKLPEVEPEKPKQLVSDEECAQKRQRQADLAAELEQSKAEDERYVRENCKPTMKHTYDSRYRTSKGPERAWICNGRLVTNVSESVRTQWIVVHSRDVRVYLQRHCR